MSEKPLPCPFCGCEPLIGQTLDNAWYAMCIQDHCCKLESYWRTEAKALTAWNTRAAIQADAEPVAWMYANEAQGRCHVVQERSPDPAEMTAKGWTETPLYAHPPVDNRVSTSSPVDDRGSGNTSGKLRDAVEVWEDAYGSYMLNEVGQDYEAAAAVIEADREAVRAELAAEVAHQAAWINQLRSEQEAAYETLGEQLEVRQRNEAELAKIKALAETLAGALDKLHEAYCADDYGTSEGRAFGRTALIETRKALRKWEEARDES